MSEGVGCDGCVCVCVCACGGGGGIHAWLKIDVFLLSAMPSAEISKTAEMIIPRVNTIKNHLPGKNKRARREQQDCNKKLHPVHRQAGPAGITH